MGRRYGRKQKRKHREQIAELTAELRHKSTGFCFVSTQNQKLKNENDRLKDLIWDWDNSMRRMFGEYSALTVKPVEVSVVNPIRELPVHSKVPFDLETEDLPFSVVTPAGTRERMRRWEVFVEYHRAFAETQFRLVETNLNTGRVTYCVSDNAKHILKSEEFAQFLAKQIIEHLKSKN